MFIANRETFAFRSVRDDNSLFCIHLLPRADESHSTGKPCFIVPFLGFKTDKDTEGIVFAITDVRADPRQPYFQDRHHLPNQASLLLADQQRSYR